MCAAAFYRFPQGALDKRLGPKPTLLTPHQSGETVAAAVVARDKGSSAGELESKEGEVGGKEDVKLTVLSCCPHMDYQETSCNGKSTVLGF